MEFSIHEANTPYFQRELKNLFGDKEDNSDMKIVITFQKYQQYGIINEKKDAVSE